MMDMAIKEPFELFLYDVEVDKSRDYYSVYFRLVMNVFHILVFSTTYVVFISDAF